jgi:hypothetical protein
VHDGKYRTLKPLIDNQIKSDMVLVVRKEKLHKAKPQPRLAKLQQEEHDARSVSIEIVSAIPVDDKPFVLVSDKPVEFKPLMDERKNIATCSTVCVDKGVQTDDSCADRVSHDSVHMATRVEDRSIVRTPVRRFVGAAVCMHKGKDERVRQLCGLGIAPILQGRTKKVHVQQQRAPSRVDKKMVVAPKSKLMWLRKAVPNVMSSQASQEGGCGEVGRRDLNMAHKRDVVDITPPFRADPPVLRTTLFEGGGS